MVTREQRDEDRLVKFGQRVRGLRQQAGLSQEELAAHAGLHRTYIGSVERGERNVALLNCYALAEALGVAVQELISGSTT